MIQRRSTPGRWAWLALLATAHCGSRVVDAVDLGQTPGGAPQVIWPTPTHGANSDPWLALNHDSLVEMRPRVLVLDFYNHLDLEEAQQQVAEKIEAISVSSRYRGYADSTAFSFLNYAVVKLVDLTDHPPPAVSQFESRTLLPVA